MLHIFRDISTKLMFFCVNSSNCRKCHETLHIYIFNNLYISTDREKIYKQYCINSGSLIIQYFAIRVWNCHHLDYICLKKVE